jgi:hypothetical protein
MTLKGLVAGASHFVRIAARIMRFPLGRGDIPAFFN